MVFEVIQDSTSSVVVSESFTLYVTDCSDATTAGLSFHTDGPIIDQLGNTGGSNGDNFHWNYSGYPDTTMTLQPINHNTALCGAVTTTIETSDPDNFDDYGTYDSVNGEIVFNFANRDN